jgi:hypothetical protein
MKRLALVWVALLIMPMLVAACSSKSRDTAEDYVKAVLKGDTEKAQALACDSYKEQTKAMAEAYANVDVQKIDLVYDIGKGGNQKEIIVTGAYTIGTGDDAKEVELGASVRVGDTNDKIDTRIVLDMKKQGGDWCATDKSVFGVNADSR